MKMPRNPLLVLAIAIPLGLVIGALGIFPWSFLAQLNARLWAGIPWCVPLGLVWLALFLAYLNGRGWPRASAPTRKQLLRARPLHGATAIWACLAGATGLVTLVTLYFVSIQFVNLPSDAFRPRNVAAASRFVIVPIMLTNAIVAGVAEEAAYRGYMQGMLECRFNRAVAVGLVTVVFTGLHVLGGAKFFPLAVPVCAASIVLGALTATTGSIIPAIVVHVLTDAVTLPFEWGLLGPFPIGRLRMTGIDPLFITAIVIVVVGSVGTLGALLRLRELVHIRSSAPSV
jgi:membrane protease YdiL (CAAX protease family)